MAEKKEKELSFEESLESLEEIVKRLETGEVPLDNAIDEFNKAVKIAKDCDSRLKQAEEAITKLVKDNGDLINFEIKE